MSVETIVIPQMVGFDKLVKIIIAYLKVGADKEPKSYSEAAPVAGTSANTVRLNGKFFEYIGMLEGERGSFKLTERGKKYAQALDWGKLAEANSILNQLLKDNLLAKRALSYVDIHQPVLKDDLVSQIAIISGKPKENRYVTGIRGFVDMLVTSGLLESDSSGNLTVIKDKKEEIVETRQPSSFTLSPTAESPLISLPVTLTINIDEKTDINKLREVLKVIKEILLAS